MQLGKNLPINIHHTSKILAAALLMVFCGLSVISSNETNNQNQKLNTIIAHLFADYCSDKGGLKNIPEIKSSKELMKITCAYSDDYGIILFNPNTERIESYIKPIR
jgi:hypothetical protein